MIGCNPSGRKKQRSEGRKTRVYRSVSSGLVWWKKTGSRSSGDISLVPSPDDHSPGAQAQAGRVDWLDALAYHVMAHHGFHLEIFDRSLAISSTAVAALIVLCPCRRDRRQSALQPLLTRLLPSAADGPVHFNVCSPVSKYTDPANAVVRSLLPSTWRDDNHKKVFFSQLSRP